MPHSFPCQPGNPGPKPQSVSKISAFAAGTWEYWNGDRWQSLSSGDILVTDGVALHGFWKEQNTPKITSSVCADVSTSGLNCSLPSDHDGFHEHLTTVATWGWSSEPEPEPSGCSEISPSKSRCTLEEGHHRSHVDGEGVRWLSHPPVHPAGHDHDHVHP